MLSLQWHEWEHIIGILPLLIRYLLQGISAPNTLWLIHSLPGMDGAFCFQIMIFLFSDFFHNLGKPQPSPHAWPFVWENNQRSRCAECSCCCITPCACFCASGSAWSCGPLGQWSWCSVLCTSSKVYGVLHFWVQRGDYDCGQSSRTSSRDVQRWLAGTSLAGSWLNPGPGSLFSYLAY